MERGFANHKYVLRDTISCLTNMHDYSCTTIHSNNITDNSTHGPTDNDILSCSGQEYKCIDTCYKDLPLDILVYILAFNKPPLAVVDCIKHVIQNKTRKRQDYSTLTSILYGKKQGNCRILYPIYLDIYTNLELISLALLFSQVSLEYQIHVPKMEAYLPPHTQHIVNLQGKWAIHINSVPDYINLSFFDFANVTFVITSCNTTGLFLLPVKKRHGLIIKSVNIDYYHVKNEQLMQEIQWNNTLSHAESLVVNCKWFEKYASLSRGLTLKKCTLDWKNDNYSSQDHDNILRNIKFDNTIPWICIQNGTPGHLLGTLFKAFAPGIRVLELYRVLLPPLSQDLEAWQYLLKHVTRLKVSYCSVDNTYRYLFFSNKQLREYWEREETQTLFSCPIAAFASCRANMYLNLGRIHHIGLVLDMIRNVKRIKILEFTLGYTLNYTLTSNNEILYDEYYIQEVKRVTQECDRVCLQYQTSIHFDDSCDFYIQFK
jgi:hypothetical protein